jgi:hypothetical protein
MTDPQNRIPRQWASRSALVAATLFLAVLTGMAGTWIPLDHAAPDSLQLMPLLSDGTVINE